MAQLMKGHSYRDRKPKTWPVAVEVKYDEIRCQVLVDRDGYGVRYLSYAGKPLHNLAGLDTHFREMAQVQKHYEVDAGILVNGNFNDSYRWVRSSRGVPDDLVGADLRVILFDLPQLPHVYSERRLWVGYAAADARMMTGAPFTSAKSMDAGSEAEVESIYSGYRDEGHEGAMVKTLDHTYQRKRSADWLKMKPSETYDGRVVGPIVPGTSIHGEPLDRVTSLALELEDGSTATPHGIPHDLGRDILANPGQYLGRWVEFDAMERDRQGGYRHPVFRRFREDK